MGFECGEKVKWIFFIFCASATLALGFFMLSLIATGEYQAPPGPLETPPLLTFITLGDWGMVGSDQFAVAKQMESAAVTYNVTLLVTTGDNFYPAGVENDTEAAWDTIYRQVYNTPRLMNMPWYISLGNHDHYAKTRGQAEIDYTKNKRDSRWYLPAAWWTNSIKRDNSTIQFVIFDTTVWISTDTNDTVTQAEKPVQEEWLYDKLYHSSADWLFVFGHHPVYSFHADVDGMAPLMETFRISKVDAYFAGHDHDLQHSVNNDVNFIVSGGGAKRETYPSRTPTGGRWFMNEPGFTVTQVWAERATTRFIDREGRVRYTTTQLRRAK